MGSQTFECTKSKAPLDLCSLCGKGLFTFFPNAQPLQILLWKNMELLQSLQIHPNLENVVLDRITGQILAKPKHPPMWVYDPAVQSSMILLLTPLSSWINPLSEFICLSVSCLRWNTSVISPPIDVSFITLGKAKTLISLKVNKQLDDFNYFRKNN